MYFSLEKINIFQVIVWFIKNYRWGDLNLFYSCLFLDDSNEFIARFVILVSTNASIIFYDKLSIFCLYVQMILNDFMKENNEKISFF